MEIDYRTERSIPMFLLHHLIKPLKSQLTKMKDDAPAGSPKLDVHRSARRRCDIREHVIEDLYLYDLLPKTTYESAEEPVVRKKRIYYFAGGGWQMPPSGEHWSMAAKMANGVRNATVTIVSYPLAPKNPAPIAFEPMMKLYRRILQDAKEADERVILAGDSAGGNIVLCLTLAALAEDFALPAPEALFVLSPSCDLRRQNPDIALVKEHDPILSVPFVTSTAKKWCGQWDAADPRVSPLMADISLLAKKNVRVDGIVGKYDILSPDVLLFRDQCKEAGVHGKWLEWEKQMHVFPLVASYKLPESTKAMEWMIDVLRQS